MRDVLMVDEHGKTVWRFGSLTEAALTIGIAPSSALLRIKRGTEVCGLRMVYGEDRPMTEEEKKERRNMLNRRNYARKKQRPKDDVDDKEVLTADGLEMEAVHLLMNGVMVEKVRYEVRFGRVSVTPCMKRDVQDLTGRVKVGSMGCVMCRYFKGRSRETQEVLCVFNHCMYTKGKKGGKKAG